MEDMRSPGLFPGHWHFARSSRRPPPLGPRTKMPAQMQSSEFPFPGPVAQPLLTLLAPHCMPSPCFLISVLLNTPLPCTERPRAHPRPVAALASRKPNYVSITLVLTRQEVTASHTGIGREGEVAPGASAQPELEDGCDRDLWLRGSGLDQQGWSWLVPGKRSCGHQLTDSLGKAKASGWPSLVEEAPGLSARP